MRARVVVWVRLPEVPVMVMVAGPTAAVVEAVRLRTLAPVVLLRLKDGVTPAGRPVAESATDPVKLFMPLTVIVLVPLLPWMTLTLPGPADKE